MLTRPLGSTGIEIGCLAFGAGPISQLLVGQQRQLQLGTIARAVELGVNWFDTAATYGGGDSERNLGQALSELGLQDQVYVATKVRIMPDELDRIAEVTRASVLGSLKRLDRQHVTLLQIHNSITTRVGSQPTSLTPEQVLGPGGLLETMEQLRREGHVLHLGLTGLGDPEALKEVIGSGAFATIQTPYLLLNPSAGYVAPHSFSETDHGNLFADCLRQGMGVFAIRVLAGGALAGRPPSPHTFKTPFFPLALYERDCSRREQLLPILPTAMRPEEAAIRFSISHPAVTSAIIGFASPQEVAEGVGFAYRGPLSEELAETLLDFSWNSASQ